MHDEKQQQNDDNDQKLDPRLDPRLLERLICPLTRTMLEYDSKKGALISHKAGLVFPIRDGIPILVPDEAKKLEDGGSH